MCFRRYDARRPNSFNRCAWRRLSIGMRKVKISQEKAALIAGLDRVDFLATLAAEQVDVFEVDLDSLQRELERA